MTEPKVIHATVREAVDDDGETVWHIECRFADGQKFAPIKVDGDFPDLADRIAKVIIQ